jgi:glyoxalase/bleomycin resistance protein/dioxygenase superfamily protein
MLGTANIVAFVAVADYDRSRAFYEGILGLTFVKNDGFAMVMDANGIMVRFVKMPAITPQKFTVLGWQVTDIERQVADLQSRAFSSSGSASSSRTRWGSGPRRAVTRSRGSRIPTATCCRCHSTSSAASVQLSAIGFQLSAISFG